MVLAAVVALPRSVAPARLAPGPWAAPRLSLDAPWQAPRRLSGPAFTPVVKPLGRPVGMLAGGAIRIRHPYVNYALLAATDIPD